MLNPLCVAPHVREKAAILVIDGLCNAPVLRRIRLDREQSDKELEKDPSLRMNATLASRCAFCRKETIVQVLRYVNLAPFRCARRPIYRRSFTVVSRSRMTGGKYQYGAPENRQSLLVGMARSRILPTSSGRKEIELPVL